MPSGVIVTFTPNLAGLYELLEAPGGDVSLWTAGVVAQVLTRAFDYLNGGMVNERTGKLLDSLQPEMEFNTAGWPISGSVQATAPYALMVHDGTRPHVISARAGRVLAFPMNGGMMYRQSVNHPGTSAKPYLARALEEVVATL